MNLDKECTGTVHHEVCPNNIYTLRVITNYLLEHKELYQALICKKTIDKKGQYTGHEVILREEFFNLIDEAKLWFSEYVEDQNSWEHRITLKNHVRKGLNERMARVYFVPTEGPSKYKMLIYTYNYRNKFLARTMKFPDNMQYDINLAREIFWKWIRRYYDADLLKNLDLTTKYEGNKFFQGESLNV